MTNWPQKTAGWTTLTSEELIKEKSNALEENIQNKNYDEASKNLIAIVEEEKKIMKTEYTIDDIKEAKKRLAHIQEIKKGVKDATLIEITTIEENIKKTMEEEKTKIEENLKKIGTDPIKNISKIAEEMLKLQEIMNQEPETPEESEEPKEKTVSEKLQEFWKNIQKNKKRLNFNKDEKAELQKLLEENQREREQQQNKEKERDEKEKERTDEKEKNKAKDPLMQWLMDKLQDINTNRKTFGWPIEKIKTNTLPRIPTPKWNKWTNIDGVTEGGNINLRTVSYKARGRHHRLNRVITKFNKMDEKDAKKWLNYITGMCKRYEWWRVMARVARNMRWRLDNKDILNNAEGFKKKVEEQKKEFIDNITQWITRAEETPIITKIKERIDYYAQQYYLQYTGRLLNVA